MCREMLRWEMCEGEIVGDRVVRWRHGVGRLIARVEREREWMACWGAVESWNSVVAVWVRGTSEGVA